MNHKGILESLGYEFLDDFYVKENAEITWKDVHGIMDKVADLNKYRNKLEEIVAIESHFSFAKYLNEYYEWHDSTKEGDVYISNESGNVYSDKQIYHLWQMIGKFLK